jgi:integrase
MPIPISEWTQDDLMWALLYIDWCGESGQQNYRIAINRLLISNPKLEIKDQNPLERMEAIRKDWVRSTYHKKFGVPQEEKILAQEPKTGKFKKPPDAEQVKAMFQVIKKKKFKGDAFRNLKDKNGNTVKLSNEELEDLERTNILLAISMAAKTGMRAGHKRQTEMGSLTFEDIRWKDNQINAATKTSKRVKVLTDVNEDVIKDIAKWKEKLEGKGIDTSQMHIVPMKIQKLNDYLREVAAEAGVCAYVKEYGEIRIKPGSKGKKYLYVFDKTDPRSKDPKYLHYQMNFQGQKITLDPSDPDPHLHLFRAFHLWQLALAKIPLQYAIKISYGWEDPKTAVDCYLAALTNIETKEWAKKEKEIFSAIM